MSRAAAPLPAPFLIADEHLLDALERLYRDLGRELERLGASCEACGECCRLAEYGHELWLTDLELAYLVHHVAPRAPVVPGVCPYLEDGRCAARDGRALSCRIFHCGLDRELQERLHEEYLERLRRLGAARGSEVGYGELLATLAVAAGRRDDPRPGVRPCTKE